MNQPFLPPRASVDDADWDPNRYIGLIVTLDGVVQRPACVSGYDVPAGTVTRLAVDEHGKARFDSATGDLIIETVTGLVEVSRA